MELEHPDTTLSPIFQSTTKFVLDWTINRSKVDDFEKFHVYRRKTSDIKSVLINDQPVKRNAYGAPLLDYQATDSLGREGVYTYYVFGIRRETQIPFLWAARAVTYTTKPKPKIAVHERVVTVPLGHQSKIVLKVFVYDRATDKKIWTSKQVFDPAKSKSFEINMGGFLDSGVRNFLIIVSDDEAKEALEFYYTYKDGKFIREY